MVYRAVVMRYDKDSQGRAMPYGFDEKLCVQKQKWRWEIDVELGSEFGFSTKPSDHCKAVILDRFAAEIGFDFRKLPQSCVSWYPLGDEMMITSDLDRISFLAYLRSCNAD